MSFVDKAHDLDSARRVLGLSHYASLGEVRAAWKRVAFATHPDRNDGRGEAFERARAAYELLKQDGAHLSEAPSRHGRTGCDRPKAARPSSITWRTEPLQDTVQDACREALRTADRRDSIHFGTAARPAAETVTACDHVARQVERQGRRLVFVVPTALKKGRNRVALPTALLKHKRRCEPRVFVFDAGWQGSGDIPVPEAIAAEAFPGARDVRIRFEGS